MEKLISQAVDRTEELRQALGLKMAEFCRKAGVPYNGYYSAVARHSALGDPVLAAIAKIYNARGDWLLTGEGPMMKDSTPPAGTASGEDPEWKSQAIAFRRLLERLDQEGTIGVGPEVAAIWAGLTPEHRRAVLRTIVALAEELKQREEQPTGTDTERPG